MKELIDRLKEYNLTISSCESLTGGLFAAKITSISGASKVFKGALVTYKNDVKAALLGVDILEIEKYGAISEQTAHLMATKVKSITGSDVAVSFTGNAGPDVLENKDVGLVFIGVAFKDEVKVHKCRFSGDRNKIREDCILYAKTVIMAELDGNK